MSVDDTDELIEAVKVCGARAERCICIEPPEHDSSKPAEPHACQCCGSWRGSYDGDDFEVVTWPDRTRINDPGQLAAFMRGETDDPGFWQVPRGGIRSPIPSGDGTC